MAWDFETDPAFQVQLDWVDKFIREEVEPLDELLGSPYSVKDPKNVRLVRPLQAKVREKGLWACHLTPEHGGQGWGNVRLALLNELLGRSRFGPVVFGTQAPDTGNAEILAHFGTPEQKARFLKPLLDNEIVSCFSMTEPQGGADPLQFQTRAELVGDEWVLNGEKWFSSNARWADFLIVLAVTDPDAQPQHKKMSMFIVPSDTPGIEIVRNAGFIGEPVFDHGYVRYHDVRIPRDHLLGQRGAGFAVAQVRLGGGRIHHAMRTIGEARKALEMICRRALSRHTAGSLLADKQMVQEKIADSWIELEQFRLLVLRTAWLIDKEQDYKKVRRDIAAVKVAMPKVLHDIAARAIQIHGALGISTELPFMTQVATSFVMGLADGPTEVHKITVAKQTLREYQPYDTLFPPYDLLSVREEAEKKYGDLLADLREDELEGV